MALDNFITKFLQKHYIILNIYAMVAAFACYFCMYAFRKPFSVSEFKDLKFFDKVDYKIMAITFQAIGYTFSKFFGIKFISELRSRRGIWIVIFITIAEVALIFFGFIPRPYNIFFMIINGLPLGLIWGLVFSFLEGRRTSELLGAGLCVSFIVSSGAVKSVGKSLMNHGISQFWMPALTGAIFFIPLMLSAFLLESLPDPDEKDIAARTERVVMNGKDRWRFFKTFWPGIIVMTVFYMVLTAYRDFRDNFAAELWNAFGYSETPSIFFVSEVIVALVVVIPIGLFMLIKTNMRVLISYHGLIIICMIFTGIITIFKDSNKMKGLYFMVLSGIGLYIPYVLFNSIIFDLLIATFKYKANSGFLMYICDSCGYLSSVAILFIKNFAATNLSWEQFYITISYVMAAAGIVLIACSLIYYIIKYRGWNKLEDANDPSINDELDVEEDKKEEKNEEEEVNI